MSWPSEKTWWHSVGLTGKQMRLKLLFMHHLPFVYLSNNVTPLIDVRSVTVCSLFKQQEETSVLWKIQAGGVVSSVSYLDSTYSIRNRFPPSYPNTRVELLAHGSPFFIAGALASPSAQCDQLDYGQRQVSLITI